MPDPEPSRLARHRFLRPTASPAELAWGNTILQMLLAQDGSTTRLFEAIAGHRILVHAVDQATVRELPPDLAGFLPGESFLRRLSTLEFGGHVLLDSLSYIAIDVLPPPLVQELEKGETPIGRVFSSLWT